MTDPIIPWPETPFKFLSPEERQSKLEKTRSQRPAGDFWVFAFGSLMWNPCFEYSRAEKAVFSGWQRQFHIWSTLARGTPEKPGLGLCLEESDQDCIGIAYKLKPEHEEQDWPVLWDREMVSGIYHAVWETIELADGEEVTALTFVVNKGHRQYVPDLTIPQKALVIANAHGKFGPCREYLSSTIAEIEKLEISEPHLSELMAAVERL